MTRRSEQRAVTSLARGRECQIRAPGVCNFNVETTVPCHFRGLGLSGAGYIADPLFVAWGCSSCHALVDSNKDPEVQLMFVHGILRTQAALVKEGKIKW